MIGYNIGYNYLFDDVVSILRHNLMLQLNSIGLILNAEDYPHSNTLFRGLELAGYIVDSKIAKYTKYDYIVMPVRLLSVRRFLACLTALSKGGMLILEITGKESKYEDKYTGMVGGKMSATKLKYGDRSYIVIHPGEDYGD